MNNLHILTKAIQKAKKNGYRYILSYDPENDKFYADMLDLHKYFAIIFNHSFAKAFWGECRNPDHGPLCITHMKDVRDCKSWEYHLQRMALCENPLEYLEYYINE